MESEGSELIPENKAKTMWWQTLRLGFKKATVLAASVTSVSGSVVGVIKLTQLLSNALLITLPRYWTYSPNYTEEEINYYTFLAISPLLLYSGIQGTRFYYQNYQAVTNVTNSSPDVPYRERMGEHASALIKSVTTSANLLVLYSNTCLQLTKLIDMQSKWNPWLAMGLMVTCFSANYYCQLCVSKGVNGLYKERKRGAPSERESFFADVDARMVAVLDASIAADIMVDAVIYSGIEMSQRGYITELAIIGFLSVTLAYQNQKKFVEFKQGGQFKLEGWLDETENFEENVSFFHKKINLITTTAHSHSVAMGGAITDIVVRAGKLISDKNETALPAPLLGIVIARLCSGVMKKYVACGYPYPMNDRVADTLVSPRMVGRSTHSRVDGSPLLASTRKLLKNKHPTPIINSRSLDSTLLAEIPASGSDGSINSDGMRPGSARI